MKIQEEGKDNIKQIKRFSVRPHLTLKRRHLTTSLSLANAAKRRKVAGGEYLSFYNAHVAEFSANKDILDDLPGRSNNELFSSMVLGVPWSKEEKEAFFKSLSRRGKRQVNDIVSDIGGSKSVMEVAGYIHVLDGAYTKLRQEAESKRGDPETLGLLNYIHLPAAAEISESSLAAEHSKSQEIQQYVDAQLQGNRSRNVEWSIIDSITATQADQEMEIMGEIELETLNQTSPEMVLLNTTKMLKIMQALQQEQREDGRVPTTSLYRSTVKDFYEAVVKVTRQLLKTSINQALDRVIDRSPNKEDNQAVNLRRKDVVRACRSLGFKTCLQEVTLQHVLDDTSNGGEEEEEENGVDAEVGDEADNDEDRNNQIDEEHGTEDQSADMYQSEGSLENDSLENALSDPSSGEDHELTALLDKYDAGHSATIDNHFRQFLARAPLPQPEPLSKKELKRLEKYGWDDEYEDFTTYD